MKGSTDFDLSRAKKYTSRLVDLVRAARAANENVRRVVYSPILSEQIPLSFAGNAFIDLQRSLLEYQVLRVCALFDGPGKDRVSIPTVIHSIKSPKAIEACELATQQYFLDQDEPRDKTPENDPSVREFLRKHWEHYKKETAKREKDKVATLIKFATLAADRAETHVLQAGLREFRSRTIAHNLWIDDAHDVKFVLGMESKALCLATFAVDRLHKALNRSSFDWEAQAKHHKRCADEFWGNLSFSLPNYKEDPAISRWIDEGTPGLVLRHPKNTKESG